MTPALVQQVVCDARLTSDAVRLVLYVAAKGPGRHEIPFEELAIVLGKQSDKPVRATANLARHCGYLNWGKGGGGHPNWYECVSLGATSESEEISVGEISESDSVSEKSPSLTVSVGEISESDTANGGTIGGILVNPTSSVEEPSTTTTTTQTHAEDREAAVEEMRADANRIVATIEKGPRRTAFIAEVRGLIQGDDYSAWRDDRTGSQIPWPDRPRLLRLAMDMVAAGKMRDVRFALRRFVIPQQYDPIPQRRSDDIQTRAATPLPVSVTDIMRCMDVGGTWLSDESSKELGFRKIAREEPDLWARAGPYLRQMDVTAIAADRAKRDRQPRVYEDAIQREIERVHHNLQTTGTGD